MKKIKFILNPTSGRGQVGTPAAVANLKEWFEKRLGRFDYVMSQSRQDLVTQARLALEQGFDRIVAVGGDGTVGAVASAFFRDQKPIYPEAELAVAQLGTGSDYFRSIEKNLGQSVDWRELALNGRSRQVDLIDLQTHGGASRLIAINMVGFGLSPEIVQMKESNPVWLPQTFGYLYPTVKAIPFFRPKAVKIELDDQVYEMNLLAAFISKGSFSGGGMKFGGQVQWDDGKLGVLLIPKVSLARIFSNFKSVYMGGWDSVPGVVYTTAKRVRIFSSTNEVYPVEVDGEFEWGTPVELNVLEKAIRLVCILG